MPASDRPPEPRTRPSSTVSAWSSRVWPSSTAAASKRAATSPSTAYLACRAAASGPRRRRLDGDPGTDGLVGAERGHLGDDRRRPVGRALLEAVVDGRADHLPGVLAGLEDGRGEQGEGVGAAGAGHQHGGARPTSASSRRTARRTAATAGWRVMAARGRGRPRRPGRRSRPWWGGSRGGPDGVELVHADLVDDVADEDRAVAVLRHLGLEAEQPAEQPVEGAGALAALVELAADLGDASG